MSIFRNLLMGLGGSPTPSPYTEVNWLQGNSYVAGQNYLDTGYMPNNNTEIEVKFQFPSDITFNYDRIFGTNPTGFWCYTFRGQELYISNNGSSNNYNSYGRGKQQKGVDYTLIVNNSTMVLNDETIYSGGPFTVSATNPLYLFAFPDSGNDRDSQARIYYCKIRENGVLVRDIIPVLDGNNVPCMYDRVTNTFYYNQGSGSFSWG